MQSHEIDKEQQFWRVHCHIGHHPGQWQYWFREQCCAVGWAPPEYTFAGSAKDRAWATARNALSRMKPGDWVVASLPHSRVGRLGRITELRVDDDQWLPVVPPSRKDPLGENGRRILVRWELTTGPEDSSKAVLLPKEVRFSTGEARATVRSIPVSKLDAIRAAMRDERNWVPLIGNFSVEAALSDYIALHPGRLESGMISHPEIQTRELSFHDRTRADVVLQDRAGRMVVAECKQNAPTRDCLIQLSEYRRKLAAEYQVLADIRALLIHGGSGRVSPEVAQQARQLGIELVRHELRVDFSSSG